MFKKVIFASLLVTVFEGGNLMAKTVTENTAKTVALNFSKLNQQEGKTIKSVLKKYVGNVFTSYVVNFNEGGWVMVAANDVVDPVLCFGLKGCYTNVVDDDGDVFMEEYASRIGDSKFLKSTNAHLQKKWEKLLSVEGGDKSSVSLKGLKPSIVDDGNCKILPNFLSATYQGNQYHIEWNQLHPYNWACSDANCSSSTNGNTKMKAGCTAIAVSQIIRWNHGTNNTYDWDSYPPYKVTNNSNQTIRSMAMAIKSVADELHTSYGCASSNAYMCFAPNILKKYGYNLISPYLIRENWNAREWRSLMINELLYVKPVLADGKSKNGGNHCFVISGYKNVNNTDFFYCNLGHFDNNKNTFYNFGDDNVDYVSSGLMKGMYIGLQPYSPYLTSLKTKIHVNTGACPLLVLEEKNATYYVLIIYDRKTGEVREKRVGRFAISSNNNEFTPMVFTYRNATPDDCYYLVVNGQNKSVAYNGRFVSTLYNAWNLSTDFWPDDLVHMMGGATKQDWIDNFNYSGERQLAYYLENNGDGSGDVFDSLDDSNCIVISPNPNHGRFFIDLGEEGGASSVTVTNALGKIVKSYSDVHGPLEVDLDNVNPGIYFVRAISQRFNKIEKIIVK